MRKIATENNSLRKPSWIVAAVGMCLTVAAWYIGYGYFAAFIGLLSGCVALSMYVLSRLGNHDIMHALFISIIVFGSIWLTYWVLLNPIV